MRNVSWCKKSQTDLKYSPLITKRDLAQGWVLMTSGGSTPTLRQITSATETVFIRSRIRHVCISSSSPTIAYKEKALSAKSANTVTEPTKIYLWLNKNVLQILHSGSGRHLPRLVKRKKFWTVQSLWEMEPFACWSEMRLDNSWI
jgi:hypothetical protein